MSGLRTGAVQRILLLAYHFPPIGGAGAQRNTKLARYLPKLGYRVTVITGPGGSEYRWTPIDETMVAQVDDEVRIERLSAPEPERGGRWRERAERWLMAPSAWQRWWDELAVDRAAVPPPAPEARREVDEQRSPMSRKPEHLRCLKNVLPPR